MAFTLYHKLLIVGQTYECYKEFSKVECFKQIYLRIKGNLPNIKISSSLAAIFSVVQSDALPKTLKENKENIPCFYWHVPSGVVPKRYRTWHQFSDQGKTIQISFSIFTFLFFSDYSSVHIDQTLLLPNTISHRRHSTNKKKSKRFFLKYQKTNKNLYCTEFTAGDMNRSEEVWVEDICHCLVQGRDFFIYICSLKVSKT